MIGRTLAVISLIALMGLAPDGTNAENLPVGLHPQVSGLTVSTVAEFSLTLNSSGACDSSRNSPSRSLFGTSFYCESSSDHPWSNGHGTDALGRFYQIVAGEQSVVRETATGLEEVLRSQCTEFTASDGSNRGRATRLLNLSVDAVSGDIYLAVWAKDFGDVTSCSGNSIQWTGGVVRVSGLPRLLDIVLSYEPSTSSLSFNVPANPEGLPHSGSYAVYTGDTNSTSDMSNATAMECSVPAMRPAVPGETLTVIDTTATPPLGQGQYFVVAVEHQGTVRVGRERKDGQLAGRDPTLLPFCWATY